MSVSANILAVDASATATFNDEQTTSLTTTNTQTQTMDWDFSGPVPAGEKINVKVLTRQGVIANFPYTSQVTLIGKSPNSWTWTFSEDGTYSGVSYSEAFVRTT